MYILRQRLEGTSTVGIGLNMRMLFIFPCSIRAVRAYLFFYECMVLDRLSYLDTVLPCPSSQSPIKNVFCSGIIIIYIYGLCFWSRSSSR